MGPLWGAVSNAYTSNSNGSRWWICKCSRYLEPTKDVDLVFSNNAQRQMSVLMILSKESMTVVQYGRAIGLSFPLVVCRS